jgi:hypothetical protein
MSPPSKSSSENWDSHDLDLPAFVVAISTTIRYGIEKLEELERREETYPCTSAFI